MRDTNSGGFMQKELPARKNIRLRGYDYSKAGIYFITICISQRVYILGDVENDLMVLSKVGMIAERNLIAIPEHIHGVKIDKFIVMPNHVHLILEINENVGTRYIASETLGNDISKDNERTPYMASLQVRSKKTVSKTIQQYKSSVSRDIEIVGLWQPKFHDHIIRNDDEYNKIWQYIDENPAKWTEDKYFV